MTSRRWVVSAVAVAACVLAAFFAGRWWAAGAVVAEFRQLGELAREGVDTAEVGASYAVVLNRDTVGRIRTVVVLRDPQSREPLLLFLMGAWVAQPNSLSWLTAREAQRGGAATGFQLFTDSAHRDQGIVGYLFLEPSNVGIPLVRQ